MPKDSSLSLPPPHGLFFFSLLVSSIISGWKPVLFLRKNGICRGCSRQSVTQSLFWVNFCTDVTEAGKSCGTRVPPSCSVGTVPAFSSSLDYLGLLAASSPTSRELGWKISLRSPIPESSSPVLPPWLHPCPLQPLPRGWGRETSWSLGFILISELPPFSRSFHPSQGWSWNIFPCPSSSSLPQGRVLRASIPEEDPSSSSGAPGSEGGCGTLLAPCRRFWPENSVCSGWDEGSGARGMLQQEFQVGFAPGDVSPPRECKTSASRALGVWGRLEPSWDLRGNAGKTFGKLMWVVALSHTSDGSCWELF